MKSNINPLNIDDRPTSTGLGLPQFGIVRATLLRGSLRHHENRQSQIADYNSAMHCPTVMMHYSYAEASFKTENDWRPQVAMQR